MLGIRDRRGLALAVSVFCLWLVTLSVLINARIPLSLMFLFFSICGTFYGAWLFSSMKETLVFNNQLSREHAFPSNDQSRKLVLTGNAFFALLLFAPSALMLVEKPRTLTDTFGWISVSMLFLVGFLGIMGLSMQAIQKLRGI